MKTVEKYEVNRFNPDTDLLKRALNGLIFDAGSRDELSPELEKYRVAMIRDIAEEIARREEEVA